MNSFKTKLLALWAVILKVAMFAYSKIIIPTAKAIKAFWVRWDRLIITLLIATGIVEIIMFVIWGWAAPSFSFQKGERVAIFTGETQIEDGDEACQRWNEGYVAPVSPEGEQKWHTTNRTFFPTGYFISVIQRGSEEATWIKNSDLVQLPVVYEDFLLCRNADNHPAK